MDHLQVKLGGLVTLHHVTGIYAAPFTPFSATSGIISEYLQSQTGRVCVPQAESVPFTTFWPQIDRSRYRDRDPGDRTEV